MARPYKDGVSGLRHWKLKAAVSVGFGEIAVVDLAAGPGKGYAASGSVALNLKPVGVWAQDRNNSTGAAGAVASALMPLPDRDFPFDNSAGPDLITQADVGSPCYIAGARQVAKTDGGGTRSELGTITEIDAAGKVLVQIKPIGNTL